MMGIFLICALYFVFYLFYKRINYKSVEKKSFIKIFIVSILLTLVIIGSNFDFFAKKFTESTVEISYETQKDEKIPIKKVIVDNIQRELNDEEKSSTLKLTFSKANKIIIVFEKKQNNGIVKLKDGNLENEIDLYSYKEDTYNYNVKSNKTMSLFSLVRLLISFNMIEILSMMFCLATYKLYKKNGSLILPTLFIIFVVQMIFYQQCTIYTVVNDTWDYEHEYTMEQIVNGELQGRVPIYPIIIKIFKMICGELWQCFICIFQMIVSFISVFYLYKILKMLIKWEKLRVFITFLYGVSIAVIGWNTLLLTESLALSGTIFFCYFIISYIKKSQLKYGILSVVLIFFMTFLRPSFIGFIAILFAFFLLKICLDKKNRKNNIKCLLVSILIIGITLGYAVAYYKQHDIFSITKVSVRQDLYVCMDQGFYKNSGNEQFIQDVESSIKESEDKGEVFFLAMERVLRQYGNKEIQELVKVSKRNSIPQYMDYLINLVNTWSNEEFDAYYTICINELSNIKYNFVKSFNFIKFSTIYFLIIIEGIVSVYKWIKNRKPDWIHLGLFGFIFVILFTTFIGTNAEFTRTAICVLPFSYISIGILINECLEKYKKTEN